ncbi:hypothetical protein LTR86_009662 [Recurvomyces mirabilis]|nr:hypothetical protein LTR86_009662 [Recurvomyces mirabilis]
MADCWVHVKRDVLLTHLTVDEARATACPSCLICLSSVDEAVIDEATLVTTSHCRRAYWSCRHCIIGWWVKTGNEGSNGDGDWCPCLHCGKRGVPDDELFPLHADYIGKVAAKEIKDDFFGVAGTAPRFDREMMTIKSIEAIDNAAPHIAAMMSWLLDKTDFEVDWKTLRQRLVKVATKNGPSRSIDVQRDVLETARKVLKAHRKASILDPETFAQELEASQQYFSDRIMLRRNDRTRLSTGKGNKRKREEKSSVSTNDDGGAPDPEPDGDRVREIQDHRVDKDGVTAVQLWWLGYSNSSKGLKTWQPVTDLIKGEGTQCPDLFTRYLLSVREKEPDDLILEEFNDWLIDHPLIAADLVNEVQEV